MLRKIIGGRRKAGENEGGEMSGRGDEVQEDRGWIVRSFAHRSTMRYAVDDGDATDRRRVQRDV